MKTGKASSGKEEGAESSKSEAEEAAAVKIQSIERRREAQKQVQKMREEKAKNN